MKAGSTVATIEAMKMEAAVTSAISGAVERVALDGPRQVEGGDLILVVRPESGGSDREPGRPQAEHQPEVVT